MPSQWGQGILKSPFGQERNRRPHAREKQETIVALAPIGFPSWCTNGRRAQYISQGLLDGSTLSEEAIAEGVEIGSWMFADDLGRVLVLPSSWDQKRMTLTFGTDSRGNAAPWIANHVYRQNPHGLPELGVDYWFNSAAGPFDKLSMFNFGDDPNDVWKIKRKDELSYFDDICRYDSKGVKWQGNMPMEAYDEGDCYSAINPPRVYADPSVYDHHTFLQCCRVGVDYDPSGARIVLDMASQASSATHTVAGTPKAHVDSPRKFDNVDKSYAFILYLQYVDTYCEQCGIHNEEAKLTYFRSNLAGTPKKDEALWYDGLTKTGEHVTLSVWKTEMMRQYSGKGAKDRSVKTILELSLEKSGYILKAMNSVWQTECNQIPVQLEPRMDDGWFRTYWLKLPKEILAQMFASGTTEEQFQQMSFSKLRVLTENASEQIQKYTEAAEKDRKYRGLNSNAKRARYPGKDRFKGKGSKGKGKGDSHASVSASDVPRSHKQWANTPELTAKAKEQRLCFICGSGDHAARSCPQKGKLESGGWIDFVTPRNAKRKAGDDALVAVETKKRKVKPSKMASLMDSMKSMADTVNKLASSSSASAPGAQKE